MIVAIFTHISAPFFILLCFNSCIPYFEYIIKDSPTERFAAVLRLSNWIICFSCEQSHVPRILSAVHAFWRKNEIQRECKLPFGWDSNFESPDYHCRFTLKSRFTSNGVNIFRTEFLKARICMTESDKMGNSFTLICRNCEFSVKSSRNSRNIKFTSSQKL